MVGVSTNADQFVASTGGEYEFSQVRGERRDSRVMRGWSGLIRFNRTATDAEQAKRYQPKKPVKKNCLTA